MSVLIETSSQLQPFFKGIQLEVKNLIFCAYAKLASQQIFFCIEILAVPPWDLWGLYSPLENILGFWKKKKKERKKKIAVSLD